MNLELAREEAPRSGLCRICGRSVADRICMDCGVDPLTGDLVAEALPGTLACLAMVAFALSFRTVPHANQPLPWPGQLGATFVLSFLVIERARAAREGPGGRLDTTGAFDPSALGTSLLMAMLIWP